jgi:hypothetical protein
VPVYFDIVIYKMNRSALLLAAFLAFVPVSQASELATFDEIRRQYQAYRDPTRLSYLYNRCAALQLNVSAVLQRQGQKQGARDFENLAQHYMVLSQANERDIDKKSGAKPQNVMKVVNRYVSHVSETYSLRMNDNFAKRGAYVKGDDQLEAELVECNLPEEFKKKAIGNP